MKKSLLTLMLFVATAFSAMAQTNIRYVCNNSDELKDAATGTSLGYHVPGAYSNDGKSWATAKNNIQDAINDLVNNKLSGEVWVASGTYYPTETTETTGGSTLYMSFKIPAGITVRGGFKGMIVKTAGADPATADNVAYAGEASASDRTKITNSTSSVGYYYPYQMVLDGSISASHKAPTFTWNATKHQYSTEFYGNSYHVVTFAVNGFDDNGRAKPLGTTAEITAAGGELAKLEGAMVKNGNAYNSSTDGHPHNAYGGGVYMVPGAGLEDVAVENCEASRDGGGVYMDGGGRCCHVYVANCQALGTSLASGYGGGICVDENKQIFPPMVLRSATINCVARYGGGMATRINNTTYKVTVGGHTYDMRYNTGISANVVSGCTALTEGGGVYALNGGSFTQMTIARNACYGSGITINGMKTGQSAGFYARNNVLMCNSILWGGAINGNYDTSAQFASSRSTISDKAEIYYVAMNNMGHADFTGVKATGTIKLSRYNTSSDLPSGTTANSDEGYVNFLHPLATAGYTEGAAANHFRAYEKGNSDKDGISYKVAYASACTNAGVPTSDLDTEKRAPDQKGKTADVFGDIYSSNPTLGAYTSMTPTMGPDVEDTGEDMTTPGNKTYPKGIVHIFVDPNSTYTGDDSKLGSSWATPVKSLHDALQQIDSRAQELVTAIETGQSDVFTGSVKKVVVHVMEGTTTVQGANVTGTVRSTSLEMPKLEIKHVASYSKDADNNYTYTYETQTDNLELEIVGGYSDEVKDKENLSLDRTSANFAKRHGIDDATLRNPVLYPTIVTGYVMDDYAYTTPHIFKIEGRSNITIDGLQVRYANAWSTKLDNTVTTGGAFTIKNSSNVTLKNVLIADCQASNGPAIYETGSSSVSLENCIIHNNTINVSGISGGNFEKGGVIYVDATSNISLNHCDVLRNVGYAFYNDGTVTMENSICYANMTTAVDRTDNNNDKAMAAFAGSGTVTSTYKHNLFDTHTSGLAEISWKADDSGKGSLVISTNSYDVNYPRFINPTANAGISEGGDVTFYGRSVNFMPYNTSPLVNNASTGGVAHTSATASDVWGTDISTNTYRDYGGLPDIGAVENHLSAAAEEGENANTDGQPMYGSLYYVKDYGDMTTEGDGMSWASAINGNAYYHDASGTFLGAEQEKTISWSEITSTETTTTYDTADFNFERSTIQNPKYYIIKHNYFSNKFLKISNGTVTTVDNENDADWFIITNRGLIYDYQAKVYLTNNGTKLLTSKNAPSINWEFVSSDGKTGGYIRNAYNSNTSYYLCLTKNNSTNPSISTSALNKDGYYGRWKYESVTQTTTETRTEHTNETVTGIKGLQYAVNHANRSYASDKSRREVWVAKGTYTSNQAADDNSVSQPYAFMMKEGVNVYGGFPDSGNPCQNQRDPKDYETILQPQTSTPFVTMTFVHPEDNNCYMNVTNWGANANEKNGNEEKSLGRVLVQPYDFTEETAWDGFTLRYGYLNTAYMKKIGVALKNLTPADVKTAGGAGALLQSNGRLTNCVVKENLILCYPNGSTLTKSGPNKDSYNMYNIYTYMMGGAGIFMVGDNGATVENCEINKNQLITKAYLRDEANKRPDNIWMFGAGIYQTSGEVYNTIIHDNSATTVWGDADPDGFGSGSNYNHEMILGAGTFVANGNFYNNTIVNNLSSTQYHCHNNHCSFAGVHVMNEAHIYNSIIADNISHWGYEGKSGTGIYNPGNGVPVSAFSDDNSSRESRDASKVHVTYSFVDVNKGAKDGSALVDLVSANDEGNTNIYLNCAQGSSTTQDGLYTTDQVYYKSTTPASESAKHRIVSSASTATYHLKAGSPAINTGTESITGVTIPNNDAAYDDRVQDCTIDMGAYEYNDANAIAPDLTTEPGKAIYYVTPYGKGMATASDPENAACAAKLQKVIDAAGRYKYGILNDGDTSNDNLQVIVKVANSYSDLHPASGDASNFTYYACRTTNQDGTDQNVRIWSIIIPRGVEVWGGYSDVGTGLDRTTVTNADNGFYSRSGEGTEASPYVYTDKRDILGYPTYFDATYTNTDEDTQAYAYHVVSFSDNVFDANGVAYKETDSDFTATASTSGTAYKLGSEFGRAVIDGIFITGGKANAVTSSSSNVNVYGGAALVNEYAHVRNCIVRDNEGNYGGALALTKGALVSGCLIDQNTANNTGGGVYVLSDEENENIGVTSTDMPYIYTSTIVNNTAEVQGGGLSFNDKDNVRINSTVIWQNHCSDMANIAGTYSPEKTADDNTAALDYFPIAYSAIQNLRAAGPSNISVDNVNKKGTRFWQNYYKASGEDTYTTQTSETAIADESDFNEFGYYKLTNISALLRTGMPTSDYDALVTSKGLTVADFAEVDRKAVDTSEGNLLARTYIDIGARALAKKEKNKELMLRLFVAQPEDLDADAVVKFQALGDATDATDEQKYYSQQGSSFAYPFQNLQDALDYIYGKRGCILGNNNSGIKDGGPEDNANYMPFEICVAKGTYLPTEDLMGTYSQSYSNTFAIPEGVGIYGGFAVDELGDKTFYGRYNKAKSATASELPVTYSSASATGVKGDSTQPQYITANVTPVNGTDEVPKPESTDKTLAGYTVVEASTDKMLSDRVHEDVNGNSIIEPWEFQNQTILSGKAVGEGNNGVFHVLTVVADQNVYGVLPPKAVDFSTTYDNENDSEKKKYMNHEHGQPVILNGLTVSGGNARHFHADDNMDELSKSKYYFGGGLLVDGNRYSDDWNTTTDGPSHYATVDAYNTAKSTSLTEAEWQALLYGEYKHNGVSDAVAYRDEIVCISQCKFIDNVAGYGGAIASNSTVDVYNSTFEENLAEYGVDKNVACDYTTEDGTKITSVDIEYPGQGGAVYSTNQFSAYNTVFANNEARSSDYTVTLKKFKSYSMPDGSTIRMFSGIGGAIFSGYKGYFHLINCDMVRNMANTYPCVFTRNPNKYVSTDSYTISNYNQFVNTVAWGNEINPTMYAKFKSNDCFKFGAPLICNYGTNDRDTSTPYGVCFGGSEGTRTVPISQADLDANYSETAWFSAYENGRGITCNNKVDMRDAQFRPNVHAVKLIEDNGGASGQNCDIEIDSENATLDGPNFVSPSKTAGIDGYNESADWSPARLNNMTDQGSGRIVQNITNTNEVYTCTFPSYTEAGYASVSAYDPDRTSYSNETTSDYVTSGAYSTTRFMTSTNYANTIPIGEDFYMKSLNGETSQQMLWRISYDPNPTHNSTYIDIGVYEYPHTPLKYTTVGDEVDVLWVSSQEKPDNGLPEGSAWSQPTSDLQRAIETLLSSRNGHRKEIRLMDGTFSPTYTIEDNLAFVIDTKNLNSSVVLPVDDSKNPIEFQGVRSLTIKGGYSKDLNDQYDVDLYPAIIRQKNHASETSARWNHLFYIKDATQRYGFKPATGYNITNGFGWWKTESMQQSKPDPQTIPIEIEGVSLVNNQSDNNTNGSAIYYEDQQLVMAQEQVTPTNGTAVSTDLFIDPECTNHVPSSTIGDGSTTYYKTPKTYTATIPTDAYITTDAVSETHKYVDISTPYKFILSRSTIMNSGSLSKDATSSAVYIGNYGGKVLIYNNVFHSNYGNPLVAYGATTINNTFALNKSQAVLNDMSYTVGSTTYTCASSIVNSAFWKNNSSGSTFGAQFSIPSGDVVQYTSYTNATEDTSNKITALSDNNTDATAGPNFVDPKESVTTDSLIEARDFRLMPSKLLLNQGNDDLYNTTVTTSGSDNPYTLTSSPVIYDYAYNYVADDQTDAGSDPRFNGTIDLGAYEYKTQAIRVIYVDPNKVSSGAGTSWGDALGTGSIQAAIDLAAIYYNQNSKEAYVFVKANSSTNIGKHTNESIILRKGVSIYGSVNSDYITDCDYASKTVDSEQDAAIESYCKNVTIYNRNGVISPSEGHTRILGIKTDGSDYGTGGIALADGFDVTAQTNASSDAQAAITEPIIDVNGGTTAEAMVCVRNVAVHGNDISGSTATNRNLINIDNGLLYEALAYNNKVDDSWSVLSVNDDGYAASVTIEGKTTGADYTSLSEGNKNPLNNVSGTDNPVTGNTVASHVYNSITNYSDDPATWKTLSGYCYKMEKLGLNYQLTEKSPYIDCIGLGTKGSPSQSSVLGEMPASLQSFINYWPTIDGTTWTSVDRDVLGNFRLQTLGTVAGGKYDGNDYYTYTTASNGDGTTTKTKHHVAYQPKLDRGAFETWDIKQSTLNLFPDFAHDGSVEYIREGKNFIIDPIITGVVNSAHEPGFCLLEMGANLYGYGRRVELPYVAVESYIPAAAIAKCNAYVMSAPFRMDYNNTTEIASSGHTIDKGVAVNGIGTVDYDDDGGLIYQRASIQTFTYDGDDRSASDYEFNTGVTKQSDCWKSTSGEVPAGRGVLMVYGSTPSEDITYRVTSKGSDYEDNVYTEEVNFSDNHVYQTVTLYKYDDSESTDGAADFTKAEDQGWNCIGLPYLVSNYKPYNKAGVTINDASAAQPVTVKEYGPTETPSESLWSYEMKNPHTMWLYYNGKVVNDQQTYPDGTTVIDGDGGFYSVNSWDNTSWHQAEGSTPRLWMGEGFFVQNQKFSGDEELKFYIPVPPALPLDNTAYDSGSSSKSRSSSDSSFNTRYYYDATAIEELDNNQTEDAVLGDISISVRKRNVTVSGLEGGESIRIYDATGRVYNMATATDSEYHTVLPTAGIYIIAVDNKTKKIMAK